MCTSWLLLTLILSMHGSTMKLKAELLLGIVFYSVISNNGAYYFRTSRGTAKQSNMKLIM